MQADLFDNANDNAKRRIDLEDADLIYWPAFIRQPEADALLKELQSNLAWRQDHIRMYGKEVKIPRLQAWYGDKDAVYTYSGLTMTPLPWTQTLLDIRKRCETACNTRFNSVLANLYRDGQDGMGWHADNEPELGANPVIASVSFGEARDFDFRHIISGKKYRLPLAHGSLLIMAGETQKYWQHGITKRRKSLGPRVNLTFRMIHSLENQVINPY